MDSAAQTQKRQLELLMKKNPEIVVQKDGTSEVPNGDDPDKGQKTQKRSFDYSNYIRNKRKQMEVSKEELDRARVEEEEESFRKKVHERSTLLESKTAKKRAARQKKLLKQKSQRSANKERDNGDEEIASKLTKKDPLKRLEDDDELKELASIHKS